MTSALRRLLLALFLALLCTSSVRSSFGASSSSSSVRGARPAARHQRNAVVAPGIVLLRLAAAKNDESFLDTAIAGPAVVPDYERIVGPLGKTVDDIFLRIFRSKLAEQVGVDSDKDATDYKAVIELAALMNLKYYDGPVTVQERAEAVLISLFPAWLPKYYAILFSKPFPEFAARMNAWATRVAGTWLMGECEINEQGRGVLVKHCRFLQESSCASVCVNSCKIPTQNFFQNRMGLPLTMEPNYETFECQFSFGRVPCDTTALATPCLARCPTAGSLRKNHQHCTMADQVAVSTTKTSPPQE